MAACGEWAWWHPQKGFKRFFCGSGNCGRPECRKLFWSRRIRLIAALIEEHGLIRFFTLTLDPDFILGDSWLYVHEPWSKFRKRMKRKYPGWKYVAILERHKNRDVPHIHGFTNIWMHQREWCRLWEECRGGRVVWIEKVDTEGISRYVGKQIEVARYVGKDNLVPSYRVNEAGQEKRVRTLWRSEGMKASFELQCEAEWCIVKERVFDEQGKLLFPKEKKIWLEVQTNGENTLRRT